MEALHLQMPINSTVQPFIVAKYGALLAGRGKRRLLALFLTWVATANFALMLDRWAPGECVLRALVIALGCLAAVAAMAAVRRRCGR